MKKLIVLPLLLTVLAGCNPQDNKFEIKDFYNDLEVKNYTVSDNETTQIFYSDDALIYEKINQVNTGVVKMKQGIFEIHETSLGEYETHGMITPNTELSLFDGCNNFYDFSYIPQTKWTKNKKTYVLRPTASNFSVLIYTGYFASNDKDYISEIVLSKKKAHEYVIDVNYKQSALDAKIRENYQIVFNNFKKNKNEKLDNYIKSTTVTAQTGWNEYQLSALNTYGFNDLPFLSSYTIGMKLSFIRISGYASGGYACILYDCMSDVSKENSIASELEGLGFVKKGNKSYRKASTLPNLDFNATYSFITHEEIEKMVSQGEASEGDLLAYPNGYMQILFAYSFSEEEITLDNLNNVLTSSMELGEMEPSSYINKITHIDYKDALNEEAVTDEEYIAMFEELGVEPGPLYDELASYYLYIDNENDAVSYIDNYRTSIKEAGYFFNNVNEGDKESMSIKDMTSRCVEYYKYDGVHSMPKYVIDIYLFNSGEGDFSWNGVVEIVITKYTDLGILLYSGE